MVTTVTLNPAMDKTVQIHHFRVGEVNRVVRLRTDPGGKGINVSKVLAALGGRSRIVAVLGGATGQKLADALAQQGLDTDLVLAAAETRTNLKIIDPTGGTNTDVNEPGSPMAPETLAQVEQKLDQTLTPGDILVLAGSLPAGVPPTWYRDCILRYGDRGVKVFLDADDRLLQLGIQGNPYFIKPNREELSRIWGGSLDSPEQIAQAAASLHRGGIAKVMVSLGGEGALLVSDQGTLYAPAVPVEVNSTVGAGDSMVAAFTYGQEQGLTDRESFCLAMAAGAAAVGCSGTQAPDREAIHRLLPLVAPVNL